MSTSRESRTVEYTLDGDTYEAFVALPSGASAAPGGRRPAVMVCHAWEGQDDFARAQAKWLASLGYVGFAADVYGRGLRAAPGDRDRAAALMTPLVRDRMVLRERLATSVDAMADLPEVDGSRLAAIGFCFGGLCCLDMARAGLGLRGVVAFHGLFMPAPIERAPISVRVLALHGWDDPMAPPDAVLAFTREMSEAGADWQLHAFGDTLHAFTNPLADDRAFGTLYSASADRRARAIATDFLAEVLA
ncbi:MAG: dienelactone hydrolase family protein [Phycisphaeraceae bacterium]|nr:dienelactone hydrolase family protein [Phycisphaeraceae bacterium]